MKKQNKILSIALATILSSPAALAEIEATGKIIQETAAFTTAGVHIGSDKTTNNHGGTTHASNEVFKSESTIKLFIDGDVRDSSYHLEIQAAKDTELQHGGAEAYTQRDPLREAYFDTSIGDWSIRAGKQQVVWGTADGMKLLDAINPTDYSEMAQNQMEDSRLPVWMLNTESGDGGWQFIVSEGKSSYIAGLGKESITAKTTHNNGSQGDAFIMKGVDLITGKVNGLLNVAPALGGVADTFGRAGNDSTTNVAASVDDFMQAVNFGGPDQAGNFYVVCTSVEGLATNAQCMTNITNNLTNDAGGTAANNQYAQNLISDKSAQAWRNGMANPTSMFHYMPNATFATFNQFQGMTSKYVVDHNNDTTIATRFKGSSDGGLNYSFNIMNGNDTNPYVTTEWQRSDNGAVLHETAHASSGYTTNFLGSSAGDAVGGAGNSVNPVLVLTERLNRISQLGGSFDTAIETSALGPIVFRGEALYQNDVMSPVVTRRDTSTNKDLSHGFLVNSLKMEKGDRFKYVLGMDITALTNMMVSLQFIQDINLDYVDTNTATTWKYTADQATMSLTNGLAKGEEVKNFGSLFLSKPFGASGEHRWNNIFMFEENGGIWNRLDAEFSINDNTQLTTEWNKYAGNTETQFGQFADSSNIQVGFKYSF
jgi:hypothetical protein